MLDRGQRVGGFAGLRNGHDQRLGIRHRDAVAVFAGDLDAAGHAGELLDPVARDRPVVAGAAGEDQHRLGAGEHLRRATPNRLGLSGMRAADHLQRVGQRLRLLEDFLLHVVRVVAQLDGVGRERAFVHRAVGRHGRRTVGADYSHAVAPQFGDVAVFEVDHAPRHLQQGRGIGSGIVPSSPRPSSRGAPWRATTMRVLTPAARRSHRRRSGAPAASARPRTGRASTSACARSGGR
jgi:hypothetical protein